MLVKILISDVEENSPILHCLQAISQEKNILLGDYYGDMEVVIREYRDFAQLVEVLKENWNDS